MSTNDSTGVTGATVLLVDDNGPYREMAEMALSSLGYDVQTCSAPEAALARIGGSTAFQLLITDVVMAKMSGVELARQARNIRPDMKVLFCSGHPEAALKRKGLDPKLGDFLSKPITLGTLSAKLEALLTPGSLS